MYKVFFNDSIILISPETKKSFKNNISVDLDIDCYSVVCQVVGAIELGEGAGSYCLYHPEVGSLWECFKSRFTEVPASGGVVQDAAGKFLFIKRLGVWDLPKGKIEANESDREAAVREVEEECGLSGVQVVAPLAPTYHIYRSPFLPVSSNLVLKETKWFLMKYTGYEQPVPQVDEDIEAVCWFDRSELEPILQNTYSSLRDMLSRLFT